MSSKSPNSKIRSRRDVQQFLVPFTYSIRQAMERLESTEEKIVFVVDAEDRLLGSLTDGDIRRWILSDGNLKADVAGVCNRHPYTVQEGYRLDRVRKDMLRGNIGCVPVVGANGCILRLLFWKELFQEMPETRQDHLVDLPVVVMAGGFGTRLAPFTNVLPKPLIPVGDRTVIEVIINQFVSSGVSQFYLSVNYKAKLLKSFFEELAPPYTLSYIEESEPRGTAGSLSLLQDCSHESLIVTNCDIVIRSNIADIVAFHRENKYDLTLVASLKEYRIPYGVCELEESGDLAHIREKPHYDFLVNTGMYVAQRDALKFIPSTGRFDMTDLIAALKKNGRRIGVFPVSENAWVDTGEWDEYRKAIQNLNRIAVQEP